MVIGFLCQFKFVSIFSNYLSRIMDMKPIERQSIIAFFSTIMLSCLGYIATMYFAHTLGPSILGGYFLFLAYFGIFDLIGDSGFGGALVKRISEGKEQNAFLSAFISIRIVFLTISIITLFLVRQYLVDLNATGLFVPLILALIIGAFSSSTANVIYGTGKVGINKIGELLNFVIKEAFQIGAVFLGYGLAGLYGGFIAGMMAGGILYFRFLHLQLATFSSKHIKSLLKFSIWVFLGAGGGLIFTYADVIMIGYFWSNSEVGIYRTTLQLTSVATFIALSLNTVLFPKISRWSTENNLKNIENALSRAFSYSLLLAVPVCAGGIIIGDRLLYYFYGAPFVAGTLSLVILLVVQVVNVFMFFLNMSLSAFNRPDQSFNVTAICAVINIIINFILIPKIGIAGAALGTLTAMILSVGLSYRFLSRIIDVKIERKTVGSIFGASFIMAFIIGIVRIIVPITHVAIVLGIVALGTIVYMLVLFYIDSSFYKEIRSIVIQLGAQWQQILDKIYS